MVNHCKHAKNHRKIEYELTVSPVTADNMAKVDLEIELDAEH